MTAQPTSGPTSSPRPTAAADNALPPGAAAFHAGPLDGLHGYLFRHPALPRPFPGKLFLRDRLGLTGCEISLGSMPPGAATPFLHRHRAHEEVYIVLRGEGEILADGRIIQVREGSAVRLAPGVARAWRNTGAGEMIYMVVQATDGGSSAATIEDGEPVPGEPAWPD